MYINRTNQGIKEINVGLLLGSSVTLLVALLILFLLEVSLGF